MRPSEVALNLGTPQHSPRTSSDFEEIPYPHHWTSSQGHPEELPLHYMSEETTRRRVPQHLEPLQTPVGYASYPASPAEQDDGGGKDVYAKMRQSHGGLGGGRPRRLPPPPPTSVVCPSASPIFVLFRPLASHILTCLATKREFISQNLEHIPPVFYTLLSCWTRFHGIGRSDVVVWDEAHFGKFGSHYLKREFYFDVHPPLGKMLVGLAGLLSGYDGSFEFKSGEKYPENVPYVAMRVMIATFGVAMVPLAWYTAVELGMSWKACHLVALMVLLGQSTLFQPTARRTHMLLKRRWLVMHFPFHSFRLYVIILHLYYRFLPHKIPQSTILVSRSIDQSCSR